MSMSKLNDLIQELCPNGVDYKCLWEVTVWDKKFSGTAKKAQTYTCKFKHVSSKVLKNIVCEDGNVRLLSTGNFSGYCSYQNNKELTNEGEIITLPTGGTANVKYHNGKFIDSGNLIAISSDNAKYNLKYLYYYLININNIINDFYRGAAMKHPAMNSILNIKIPVPPLPVQEEIVRVLDNFTELTTELTTELLARKKQYEFYRDGLLTFGDNVEWKTLKEVALDFGRGKSKHRPRNDSKMYGGSIPFIQTGDIRSASHIISQFSQTYSEFGLEQSKLWHKGTLCITIAANIAETAILGFDSCFPDSIIGFVANPQKTSSSYVEYLLTSFRSKLQSKSTGSAQENINLATFENLLLPFPSLSEQKRIVDILDKFDMLVNDISKGLPAEIEARKNQYEYYRDKLLTFKELI